PRSRRGARALSSAGQSSPASQGQGRGSSPRGRATAGRPDTTRDTAVMLPPRPAGGCARIRSCLPAAPDVPTVGRMEGTAPLLPGSLDELRAAHPEVGLPCCVEGTWHATVSLDGGCGYVHG